MIQLSYKYVSVVVLSLMCLFAVSLALDAYNDSRCVMEDLLIETFAEPAIGDFEWDEDEADNWDGGEGLSPILPQVGEEVYIVYLLSVRKTAMQSDEQKRGLVRRFAFRKGIDSTNHILI